MKKALLTLVICAVSATSSLFAQHTQSIQFINGPATINPGDTFSFDIQLTFGGYSSFGLSYWLETANALAPFLTLTSKTHFTFPDPNQPIPGGGSPFNSIAGSTAGFMLATTDLGATVNDPTMKMIAPGTYTITHLTFTLAAGAPTGMFALRTTTTSPRISEVTDTDFNDNNIIPAGTIMLNIVPEPSTLALVGLGAVVSVVVAARRRKASR